MGEGVQFIWFFSRNIDNISFTKGLSVKKWYLEKKKKKYNHLLRKVNGHLTTFKYSLFLFKIFYFLGWRVI